MSRKEVCRRRGVSVEARRAQGKTTHLVLGDEKTDKAQQLRELRERDLADEAVDEGGDERKDRLAGGSDNAIESESSL